MKKDILLLGNTGFIGSVIKKHLIDKTNLYEMDNELLITSESIDNYISKIEDVLLVNNISILINSIAMANLDECETDQEKCKLINELFVTKLCDMLAFHPRIKLVHISTNAVYDGDNAPYSEADTCYPMNFYGRCKLKADEYIINKLSNYVIARPITVYGPKKIGQRDNPVTFYIRELLNNKSLTLVDDNIVNMIHVDDLAKAIELLSLDSHIGVFNLSGDHSECRYDLGIKIASLLNISLERVKKVSGSSFKMAAKRPYDTSFLNEKMKTELGINPRDINSSILEIINEKSY